MRVNSIKRRSVEPTDVYCMTVPEHHNFAVKGNSRSRDSKSVFAHNCDADTD